MNILPENIIREIVKYLSATDCARLSACSRRLRAIVRLPYDKTNTRLSIYNYITCEERSHIHWTLMDKTDYHTHMDCYRPTFAKLHDGLRSRLMKPLLGCTHLLVDYSVFDDRGLNNELLEAFHGAPIIAELRCSKCYFAKFKHFCRLINNVRASLYTFRIPPRSNIKGFVNKYSKRHPDKHFHLSVVPSRC